MEGRVIPALIFLCYAGQRVLRAAAIWEGFVFLGAHPEFASLGTRCLQALMIALEVKGAASGLDFVSRGRKGQSDGGGRKDDEAAVVGERRSSRSSSSRSSSSSSSSSLKGGSP
jgi:hypothetical protein